MDDLYQYTASAVNSNSNNNNEQDPQNDPLISAFTNFGWGQRFNSLMDTVKKQSEVMVDVTKKDLQEFANILRDDTSDLVDHLSQSTNSTTTITNNETDAIRNTAGTTESTSTTENIDKQSMISTDSQSTTTNRNAGDTVGLYASLREGLGKINTVNFTALRDGLSETLSKQPFLPSQLSSISLPDNINLGELRQELDEGTRFAELYLQKFGTEVIHVLNQTITVLEPEEEEGSQQQHDYNQSNRGGPRIFASRTEAMIAKLQTDHDALLTDPKATLMANHNEKQIQVLETFNTGFNIEEYTPEISRLLEGSPDLRRTMEDLVPQQVDYTTFWRRYFYHAWSIDQEEQKRQMIFKGVEEEEDNDADDFKWDSDDEDTTHQQSNTHDKKSIDKGKQKATPASLPVNLDDTTHDANKSDTDYSNISEPPSTEASLVSPPLKSQTDGDDWIKTSTEEDRKKQPIDNDDDTDSDWE
ncbi:hypothetical protein BCR42DRAFT_400813 [Absidia repens]|uniref:BSD domain-containing protein n=1 Tax=Absidia repens TaxID=90262 RepID=A0A1X2J1T3_9FUNG|nr:hypothetical protein BCR42DRAFT_400813 [Absidia repens]